MAGNTMTLLQHAELLLATAQLTQLGYGLSRGADSQPPSLGMCKTRQERKELTSERTLVC